MGDGHAFGRKDEKEGEEERRGWRMGSEKKGLNENVRGLRRILGVYMLLVAQITGILIEAKTNDAYSST